MTDPKRAVVLLSGGLDSTTALALATRRDNYVVTALSFEYGQRHRAEIRAAEAIVSEFAVWVDEHHVLHLPRWGGSALNDRSIHVAKDRPIAEMSEGIPDTYVPARNTIFLAFAGAVAEVRQADRIYIGVNALDYSGYPDCRPWFISKFQDVLDAGTKVGDETGDGPEIIAPLIDLTKSEIIELGSRYAAPYHLTHSCYDPIPADEWIACGRCDSCQLRLQGFADAGMRDPIRYAEGAPAA